MKFQRSTVLPIILLVYLAIMAVMGWDSMKRGETSPTTYWITIGVTIGLIIALHFVLKRRERLRHEREHDIKNSDKNSEYNKSK